MHILFNATTLRKGGPLQRAVTFLRELQNDALGHVWHVAASDTAVSELTRLRVERIDDLQVFPVSPAKSLRQRRRLGRLEESLCPDCVFTFTGPAYVRFHAPHLLGCTSAWLTHWSWQACRASLSARHWAANLLSAAYKGRWLRCADAWVVQTPTARQGLQRRLRVPLERIGVVPNTCGSVYLDHPPGSHRPQPDKWRFLAFAAPYPHKRLDLIPDVARRLFEMAPNLAFEFVLTLPPHSSLLRSITKRARSLGVDHTICNQGPVPVAEGPSLYATCDICFLPTLLETFSATYPESMAMGLPIVTTDLPFAKDVCGDAACYFQPNDARSAARELLCVVRDRALRERLVDSGKRVLATLPSPSQQNRCYGQLLERLVARRATIPL